jgi:hypothetical protein
MRITIFKHYHSRNEASSDGILMLAIGFSIDDALSIGRGSDILVNYSLSRKGTN